ncbi:MAG: nicotinate (nicotinamide) nucleotide adenylyltransferase [Phycisphaerae bacterium]|nr:nicotinate (nicotinamide) nucleotide adenylyltransferase [Phycisphaerae bacterium]
MAEQTIIFGGTFDPVHNGHLTTARCVAKAVGSKSVLLVPTAGNPLKSATPLAPEHRLAMLTAATRHDDLFAIDDVELYRTPPSFTIDTVRYFQQNRTDNLAMIIGADMIPDLPRWRAIDELLDSVQLLIASRPPDNHETVKRRIESLTGQLSEKQIAGLVESIIPTPLVDISSTEIRRRIAARESITDMTPPPVEEYIMQHGLYAE